MKIFLLSMGLAFLGVSNLKAADQPKIEVASAVDGVFVTYGWHSMVIELKGGKFRYWFSSDAKGNDVSGLEGSYTVDGDKIVLKHPDLIPLVSDWTVRSIDGVVTLWRSDALTMEKGGEFDPYLLGKKNFFLTGSGSILVPSKKTAEDAWKSPQIVTLTEAEYNALLEKQRENAKRAGHGRAGTRPPEYPLAKTTPARSPSFAIDPALPCRIEFGRGSATDGLDTMALESDGNVILHRRTKVGGWETASLKLPRQSIERILALVKQDSIMDMAAEYHADVRDGIQWLFSIAQGERSKAIYFNNHFPEQILHFATFLDVELSSAGIARAEWKEVPGPEEEANQRAIWNRIK